MNNKNRLEDFKKNPTKALWKLSIPMMLGMSAHALYTLIDLWFIGHWIEDGANVVIALADVFPLLFIIMGITMGLGSGSTTVIAQSIGENNKKSADSCAEHALLLGGVISIFFILIGFLLGENLLSFQGNKPSNLIYATDYYYTILCGVPFMVFSMFFRAILSGEGDAMLPMKILGFGTILNVILDPILITYFQVKGAALATIVSQICVFLMFLYVMIFKSKSFISINFKKFKYNYSILLKILKIGVPAALSMVIMSMGVFFFNTILKILENGDAAKGAYRIAHQIEHLVFIPFISISTSMVTLIGMFYGAKEKKLILYILKYSLKSVLFISIIFSLIFFNFGDNLIALFLKTSDSNAKNIINIGAKYFQIFSFATPFIAITMLCSRSIQGLGKSTPMFIITFLRVIGISCILAFYFINIKNYGVEYAWYSILISCLCSAFISSIWVLREIKKIEF